MLPLINCIRIGDPDPILDHAEFLMRSRHPHWDQISVLKLFVMDRHSNRAGVVAAALLKAVNTAGLRLLHMYGLLFFFFVEGSICITSEASRKEDLTCDDIQCSVERLHGS